MTSSWISRNILLSSSIVRIRRPGTLVDILAEDETVVIHVRVMQTCFRGKVLVSFCMDVMARSSSMLLMTTARSMGLRNCGAGRLGRMASLTFVSHSNDRTQVFRGAFTTWQNFLSSLMSTIWLAWNQVTLLCPASGVWSMRFYLLDFGRFNSRWVCSRITIKVSKRILFVTAPCRCRILLTNLGGSSHRGAAFLTSFSGFLL